MRCEDCSHAEMCKWIDELEGRGCDFLSQEPCDDAISREDAREAFSKWFFDRKDLRTVDEVVDKLPSVTQKSVLEQIRAEIEAARYGLINDGLDVALRIIDKHCPSCGAKMESEDKE